MPASYGYGRIIDHDNARIFRDVNSFIMHIRGSVPYYGAETIRNNLPNTFKGQAFSWYNDILPDATKSLLHRDPDPTCGGWCDQLLQNFKQSGAHAMKEITSQRTNYTLQMLKRGDSIIEWFSGMISLAADADFRTDQHKLNFIYHKFDAELRKDLPQVQPMHTVQQYSQLLRECEESLRDAAREQDRRLGFQFQRYGGYNPTRGYPNIPQSQRTPRYDQYRRDRDTTGQPGWTSNAYQDTRPPPASPVGQVTPTTPERAKNSPLLLMDKEHSSPRKAPPTANFQNYLRRPAGRDNTLPSFLRRPFDRNRTIAPSRPCRFCEGNHFDSVCTRRDKFARSPRVQFIEEDEHRAVYHVEQTEDTLYDYEHQDWVDSFFSAGYSYGDFERYAAEYGGGPINDEVDCGHFSAKTAPPTPTNATASGVIARQAAPRKGHEPGKADVPVPVFHTTAKAPVECEQCQAQFPSKTKLFKHLRQTNHFTPTVNHVETPTEQGLGTGSIRDPIIITSQADAVPGTGYEFRKYNFLEIGIWLAIDSDATWGCLDTGCGMSLVDVDWITERLPQLRIINRASSVRVRGIGSQSHVSNSFIVMTMYFPNSDGSKLAKITRELHLVEGLGCKLLIGIDIIKPDRITPDVHNETAHIGSCGLDVPIRIMARGRQIVCRKVVAKERKLVMPGSRALVPIAMKSLPTDRDFEFTPVYDEHTRYLAQSGGFLRAMVNADTTAMVFHNTSMEPVVIHKDLKVGYVEDWTPQSYHGHADIRENDARQVLEDSTMDGVWVGNEDFEEEHGSWLDNQGMRMPEGTVDDIPVFHGKATMEMGVPAAPAAGKFGAENVDVNSTDDVTADQTRALRALCEELGPIFEDRGLVADEPEENWMRITLKPGVQLHSKGP
jgi:hypothetical protein